MSTPIQPVPDIVLASEFPTLADRPAGTYNAKAAAWANSENAMAESVKAIADATHLNAIATHERAQSADADANRAEAAAQAASNTAGAQEWKSGQDYEIGEAVWSPLDMQTYRRRVAGAGTTDPSLDLANWERVSGLPSPEGNGGRPLVANSAGTDIEFAEFKIGTNAQGAKTISTSDPSGGQNGDIHYKVES